MTVELPGLFALRIEIDHLRDLGLHAEGELVGLNAGLESRIVRVGAGGEAIESIHQPESQALLLPGEIPLRLGVVEGILQVHFQPDGIVGRTEIMTVLLVEVTRPHADELGKIVIQRAEPVGDPCTDRRSGRIESMFAGMELNLGPVIVVGRPHRANYRDIIDTAADVREPVAHLDTALPILPESGLERIDDVSLLPVGVIDHDDPDILQPLGILDMRIGRLGDRLSPELREERLRIKALHVAHATSPEEPDHLLCLRGKLGMPVQGKAIPPGPDRFTLQQAA